MPILDRTRSLSADAPTSEGAEHTEGATSSYNQNAWAILYGAFVKSLGISTDNFQMSYPYQAWDWATQNLGYISPAQYDSLSTIPSWTAIGKYTSTASRANDQYIAFLNVISPDTSDPELRQEIADLFDALTDETNTYDRTLQQAKQAFNSDTAKDQVASFTEWLGTMDGYSWQSKLNGLQKSVDQAQANYQAKVAEAKTPNLVEALEAYGDDDYWSQLNDPQLSKMPKVPNWSTPITAAKWKDRAANGDVPGSSIDFSNGDSAYEFSKTWAGASAEVGDLFWAVQVSGSWQRVTSFESDASLSVSVQFEGIEEIGVQPGPWYVGVKSLANGPYKRGYSKDGADGTKAAFGKDGFFPLLKTGMYVGYRPSFSIRVSTVTFNSFQESFTAATGIRVGPFTFTAKGGAEKAGWSASASGLSFTGTTESRDPFILGYTVNTLP